MTDQKPVISTSPITGSGTVRPDAKIDLVDRLRAHRILADVPPGEVEWVARHGQLRRLQVGSLLASPEMGPVEEMTIVLSGRMAQYVTRGGGRRKVIEWCGGDVTGLLPYSRLTLPPGEGIVEESSEVVAIHRRDFPEMVRECQTLTAKLVQLMLDRARHFTQNDLHDEKMVSLGRLAAGLAHELDNPASAVVRSSKLLSSLLREADAAGRSLGSCGVTPVEVELLHDIRESCLGAPLQEVRSPLDQAMHEERMLEWLDAHGIELENEDTLTDSPIGLEMLDAVANAIEPERLGPALRWVVASCAALGVSAELRLAATRISELVKAVKGFTRMDGGVAPQVVDVEEGLTQTLTVLRSKARQKSIKVRITAAPDVPQVFAPAGELNQIWANLIENALDAAPTGGSVEIVAERAGEDALVRIVDDGPGISPDIQGRIFEPFFTTKPVGQGTGLGLDIVRRLVLRNEGAVDFTSEPGRTEFHISLPAHQGQAEEA